MLCSINYARNTFIMIISKENEFHPVSESVSSGNRVIITNHVVCVRKLIRCNYLKLYFNMKDALCSYENMKQGISKEIIIHLPVKWYDQWQTRIGSFFMVFMGRMA